LNPLERQLVGIKTLGTTPKLRAVKLFDDRLETIDFAVPMLDCRGDVAYPSGFRPPSISRFFSVMPLIMREPQKI
jgi:hypothetical protein